MCEGSIMILNVSVIHIVWGTECVSREYGRDPGYLNCGHRADMENTLVELDQRNGVSDQ